jgi:hypothetical protein
MSKTVTSLEASEILQSTLTCQTLVLIRHSLYNYMTKCHVEWLTLLPHIWKVPGSNISPEKAILIKIVCVFSQSLHMNARIIT